MNQMRVDIELKLAGIELNRQQTRCEPLKVVVASIAAGAALMGASVALMAAVFRHFA